MKETVLTFGNQLMGVLTQPERGDLQRPVVLIPNTGIEHRVGPNRLHVRIARALAEAGYASARIDLSGLGDSPAALDGNSTDDLRAAMDELSRRGAGRRFVAVGLCSGSHDAHRLALADERVVGAAFLDGYAYRTPRFFATYLWQRASDPARWAAYVRKLAHRAQAGDDLDVQRVDYYRQPPAAQFRSEIAALMERGLALCFIYTGQMQYIYNYACQLTDRFPELRGYERFELHHMAHADHTFSTVAMKAQLAERLLTWLRRTGEIESARAAPALTVVQAA
ncbi:MAG TPA: hypothetical protein VHE37_14570 [Nevskiaceae bacterium]|nr:hypothetical protein [Nevskiaceae bacterium]